MAIPSQVISIEGSVATVECFGVRRVVSTVLMQDPVALGDYISVMANTYAIEKISPEAADEVLSYLKSVLSEPAVGDSR